MAAFADRLVGRRAELAFLRERLDRSRAGSGRLVLVCGPAGIGKTRLVEELVAGAGSVPVGWGAALADPGMPPMWPLSRALRDLPGPRAALAQVVAGSGAASSGSADDAAAVTFAADTGVLDAVEEQAARTGLVLVLDDLQWADAATFRLLGRIVAEVRRHALLVVATHRDPDHPSLAGLLSAGGGELLSLHPLAPPDAGALLASLAGHLDSAATDRAVRLSGGSPLYLRTIAALAVGGQPGLPSWPASADIPEFRHLVAAALRTCGAAAAEAVTIASVVGLEVPVWLLAALLRSPSEEETLATLRPAVPAGLIASAARPGSDVVFAHALVRDAVYASLSAARRVALHARTAELLEPQAVGHDERAGEVARHFERAGRLDLAGVWAMRAADAARAAGAYQEASSYLQLALAAPQDTGNGDPAELLLEVARVQYLGGQLIEAMGSAQRAAKLGERLGRADVVARAALVIHGVGHVGLNAEVTTLCRQALSVLDDDAVGLRAQVEAQLACSLVELGEIEAADSWSRRALADADSSGDLHAELEAIRARASLSWDPQHDRELLQLGQRSVELARRLRRPVVEILAHAWRFDAAMRLADLPLALGELDQLKELAARAGLPLARWHWLRHAASLAALQGDFAACRAAAAEAESLSAPWQDDSVQGTHLGLVVRLALLRGGTETLPDDWEELIHRAGGTLPVAQAVAAGALLVAGRQQESTALYAALLATVRGARGSKTAVLHYLGEIALAVGDAAGCRVLGEVIADRFDGVIAIGTGTVFLSGSVSRWRGELDLGAGDLTAAITHLEEGLSVDLALGARPYVVRGRIALGRALLGTGDPARAVDLAGAAAAEARRLDMPGSVAAADTLLQEARAERRAGIAMSAREREVADLVGQALTNREIAGRLYLSERTVESHLRSILAKTGCRSRTDLARWLLQNRDL